MKVVLIDSGYFYADGGAMFGCVPKTAWSRRYPSDKDNGCILAMRSALIFTDCGKIILVDNGAGTKQLKQLKSYRFFNLIDIKEAFKAHNITQEDITDVILTHLHFDHCGYTTQKSADTQNYTPVFPNATHWVSHSQWTNFLSPNALEKNSYFPENMEAIQETGLLRLIFNDTPICPGITLRLYNGHTPGQIVPYIETTEHTFVFAGDVIPLAASISAEWISAYDVQPLISYEEKTRMLKEATEKNQAIIFCHDAYTQCCTVKKINNFYKKSQDIDLPVFSKGF